MFACVFAALAGCVQEGVVDPQADLSAATSGKLRPTVVALIDSGINPYHLAFAAPEGGVDTFLDGVPSAQRVRLADKGSYEKRVEADRAFWEDIETGQLYAFSGTRVFGISFNEARTGPRLLDAFDHGTGTAALVLREDPETILVMIEVDGTLCDLLRPAESCPLVSPLAAAMAWAAEQPWIDVISVSVGVPGNAPAPSALFPDVEPFLEASRKAHNSGKLVVVGAGNVVVPPAMSYYAGPPWIIAVGGAQAARGGEAIGASKIVDVVANYTEYVPRHDSIDGYKWVAGTSFSTPIVSGTLAMALREVRNSGAEEGARGNASGLPTPHVLRSALNASAQAFGPGDWNPTGRASNDTRYDAASLTAPVLVPGAQQGWGFVHGGLAGEIARRVLENDLEPPPEKALTTRHQAAMQQFRETYWSHMG